MEDYAILWPPHSFLVMTLYWLRRLHCYHAVITPLIMYFLPLTCILESHCNELMYNTILYCSYDLLYPTTWILNHGSPRLRMVTYIPLARKTEIHDASCEIENACTLLLGVVIILITVRSAQICRRTSACVALYSCWVRSEV